MTQARKAEIIRSLFDAYRSRQQSVLEDLLADDFTFTSPYDDAIDKKTYFERCWTVSIDYIRANEIEQICESGDHAFVLYKCLTVDGREFRNTEHFGFKGGKISAINVCFGATYKDGAFIPLAH